MRAVQEYPSSDKQGEIGEIDIDKRYIGEDYPSRARKYASKKRKRGKNGRNQADGT